MNEVQLVTGIHESLVSQDPLKTEDKLTISSVLCEKKSFTTSNNKIENNNCMLIWVSVQFLSQHSYDVVNVLITMIK